MMNKFVDQTLVFLNKSDLEIQLPEVHPVNIGSNGLKRVQIRSEVSVRPTHLL